MIAANGTKKAGPRDNAGFPHELTFLVKIEPRRLEEEIAGQRSNLAGHRWEECRDSRSNWCRKQLID